MRNLDKENPPFARPRSVASICALLPFLLGGMCSIIASEATPRLAFFDNPLSLFCVCLSSTALVFSIIPRIFNWDWRAKYFGFSAVYFASASLLGVIPWLCVVMYSSLPVWVRTVLVLGYATPVAWWCRRFVIFYREVYSNISLRNFIYIEDSDAVYYSQKNDNFLLEKKLKLKQYPANSVILVSLGLAFLLVPFIQTIKILVGLPFAHTFLMVGSYPIVLMVIGFSTRGYLIFYYYPWKIKKETGKEVFVDLTTKTKLPASR